MTAGAVPAEVLQEAAAAAQAAYRGVIERHMARVQPTATAPKVGKVDEEGFFWLGDDEDDGNEPPAPRTSTPAATATAEELYDLISAIAYGNDTDTTTDITPPPLSL